MDESEDRIYNQRSYQAFALRTYVTGEVERQAENVFRDKLTGRELRFDLEVSSSNYRMSDSYEILVGENEGIFHNRGKPIQFSLFEPLYQSQFDSTLESRFARYLDEQKALTWWHRVAARQRSEYYLRGWKRERIWPDFIAMAGQTEGKPHLLVFETKGGHLDNPDTDYKRRVFETLEGAFQRRLDDDMRWPSQRHVQTHIQRGRISVGSVEPGRRLQRLTVGLQLQFIPNLPKILRVVPRCVVQNLPAARSVV